MGRIVSEERQLVSFVSRPADVVAFDSKPPRSRRFLGGRTQGSLVIARPPLQGRDAWGRPTGYGTWNLIGEMEENFSILNWIGIRFGSPAAGGRPRRGQT